MAKPPRSFAEPAASLTAGLRASRPCHVAEGIEAIEAAAAEAGRVFDDDHYGVLIPYLPPGLDIPAEALERVTVRRPDAARGGHRHVA